MTIESSAKRPRAFTMIELLVTMSIIGIVIAITLPAVQSVRESARVTHCQANLRQFGLAAQNFHSTHRMFPSGGWGYQWQGFSDIGPASRQPGSWTFSLLPFLEQQDLYEIGRYHTPSEVRDAALRLRMQTSVPLHSCPTRRDGSLLPVSCDECGDVIGLQGKIEMVVRGDYAANSGDGAPDAYDLSNWPLDFSGPVDLREAAEMDRLGHWPRMPSDFTGISYLRYGSSAADVTDGLSHTLLYGEKYIDAACYQSGLDWGDNEPLYGGFNNDNHRSTHPAWLLMQDRPGLMSIGSFGSAHPSGANFVLCDGSVRLVGYSIDTETYRKMGNRRDSRR